MKKHRLRFGHWATLSLSLAGFTAWPAGARAANQTASSASLKQVTSDAPGKPVRAVPQQLSTLFEIDDDNPEAHVPAAKDRIGNPLEFGYYLQDLLTRA